jgi:hypothetical protein
MKIMILAACFLFLSNAPYNLGCHFPDSLIAFMDALAEWKFIPLVKTYFAFRPSAFISNSVFYLLILIPVVLFVVLRGFKRKLIPVVFISILFFFANYTSFKYWNNTGDLQLKNYKNGIGQYLFSEYSKDKSIKVFIDQSLAKYFFQFFRIQFYVPFEIKILDLNAIEDSPNNLIYYITNKQISNQQTLHEENLGILLYRLNNFNKNEIVTYSFESGVGNKEDSKYNNRKIKVRWLEQNSVIIVNSFKANNRMKLNLKLSSFEISRELKVKLNGKYLENKNIVKYIWGKDGFQNIIYDIELNQHGNRIELISDTQNGVLPGGRRSSFLLLDDSNLIRK